MTDRNDLLEHAMDLFPPPPGSLEQVTRRHRIRHRNRRIAAGSVGLAILLGGFFAGASLLNPASMPATNPTPTSSTSAAQVRAWFAEARGRITVLGPSYDLEALDPSGRAAPALLRGYADIPLSWSADGTRLLMSAQPGELSVLSSDGTLTKLVSGGPPDWGSISPDGSTVVYQSPGGLRSISADGGKSRLLVPQTKSTGGMSGPAWSPDGTMIAVVSVPFRTRRYEIVLMHADGSGRRVLVTFSGHRFDEFGWISWSPDGSHLAFAVNPCMRCARIYVIRADGTGLRRITGVGDNVSPSWSPDGKRIAVLGGQTMKTMNPDGTGVVDLHRPGVDPYIVWNPAR